VNIERRYAVDQSVHSSCYSASIIYKTKAAAAASIAPAPPAILTAAPVNCEGVGDAEGGVTGVAPVGMALEVALYPPVDEATGMLAPYEGTAVSTPCMVKLAQPMRVLLDKWSTKESLPK
jgi:hypothetical protein